MAKRKQNTDKDLKTESQIKATPPKTPSDWKSWAIAAAGGLAGALAFVPVAWWWLAPLAPLAFFACCAAHRRRGPRFAGCCWRLGVLFRSIQWLLTIRIYGAGEWLALLGIVLFALYMSCGSRCRCGRCASGVAELGRRAVFRVRRGLDFLRVAAHARAAANPLSLIGHAWALQPVLFQVAPGSGSLRQLDSCWPPVIVAWAGRCAPGPCACRCFARWPPRSWPLR